ncbi:hypothetical protein [Streptomyces kanamyceticus]|uniref:Uncharacterized protein n=1 Tax=Streptomyces kanamyceticus TaxID=1967 RepID=A0A5J6GJI7_STRKN|nr:hypothetical protein [Streptomyces kanamyceticus]QEU94622.1 hypothetical protein CP970_30355 [Streptomyces kanamyceticus]
MSEPVDPYELRARQLRILAGLHRKRAAELEMTAEAGLAARSMRKLTEALTAAEVRDIAEHPDLAELNAQLDGFYGDDSAPPSPPNPT